MSSQSIQAVPGVDGAPATLLIDGKLVPRGTHLAPPPPETIVGACRASREALATEMGEIAELYVRVVEEYGRVKFIEGTLVDRDREISHHLRDEKGLITTTIKAGPKGRKSA